MPPQFSNRWVPDNSFLHTITSTDEEETMSIIMHKHRPSSRKAIIHDVWGGRGSCTTSN